MEDKKTSQKFTVGILILVLLSVCLVITTVALVLSTLSVSNNIFKTGYININLNDSKPVIAEQEFFFEPGMSVEKEFFIENNSTCDVYYKLYFANVSGDLADVLEITVLDGEKVLYEGTASDLDHDSVEAADDVLAIGQRKTLHIVFRYPETAGDNTQNAMLTFELCADAVQIQNNPNRAFD